MRAVMTSIQSYAPFLRWLNLIAPIFTMSLYIPTIVSHGSLGNTLIPGLVGSLLSCGSSALYFSSKRLQRKQQIKGVDDQYPAQAWCNVIISSLDFLTFATHFSTLVLSMMAVDRRWRWNGLLDAISFVIVVNSLPSYLYFGFFAVVDFLAFTYTYSMERKYHYGISYCPHCGEHVSNGHPAQVRDPVRLSDEEQEPEMRVASPHEHESMSSQSYRYQPRQETGVTEGRNSDDDTDARLMGQKDEKDSVYRDEPEQGERAPLLTPSRSNEDEGM